MTAIVRPRDDGVNPTIKLSYHTAVGGFADNPFWTEAQQRISGSNYFKMRKYYDGLGRLIQTQVVGATIGDQSRDILTDTYYDASGNVSRQSVPYDVPTGGNYHNWNEEIARTETTYDVLGRPVIIMATDGADTNYLYWNMNGMWGEPHQYSRVTDPKGNVTTSEIDSWGRTILIDAPTGPDVSYGYDEADRLVSVSRGGASTTIEYDMAGRKTKMVDPDMGEWHYHYDAIGNMTVQTDAKEQRICLYYDALNRLTGKHYRGDDTCPANTPANMNVGYWYDSYTDATIFSGYNGATTYAIGRRTGMIDTSGRSMWTFDERGRMIREQKVITGSGTFVTRWGYNSADLISWMKYPSNNTNGEGETVYYYYLNQMLVNNVIGTSTYVQQTQYDAAGRVDLRKLGSDVLRTDYVYYDWSIQGGRLQYLKTGTSVNPTLRQNLSYTYDDNGNVTTILDGINSSQKQCFLYDGLDRLTRGTTQLSDPFCNATHAGNGQYDETYAYNGTTGNLSSKEGYTLTYGDANHDHAVTAWNGWSFTYDANGNMVTRVYGGVTYTLTYDQENHLTGMTGGGVSASFVYDGDGNRVKGTIAGVTMAYLGNYAEWITNAAYPMVKYYYAGSTRIAMRSCTSAGSCQNHKFLFGDHLGSNSFSTDMNGNNAVYQYYYPWGEKRWSSGTLPTTFQYTGQRREKDLGPAGGEGLYYYGARWYDSVVGRFVSADNVIPGGVQGLDRYAYTANNPVRYIDPSGNDYCESSNADPEECQEVDQNADGKSDLGTDYFLENYYGVSLGEGFSSTEISAIYAAVQAVGAKFGQTIGGGLTSGQAFTQVYGYLSISSGCSVSVCGDVGGITLSAHNISFSILDSRFMRARNNVVHELGHSFNDLFNAGKQPADLLGQTQMSNSKFPNRPDFPVNQGPEWVGDYYGFASKQNQFTWQQSYANAGATYEEFADQFLGWTFNIWQADDGLLRFGPLRSAWMNSYMPGWIK